MSKEYKENLLGAFAELYSPDGKISVLIKADEIVYWLPKQKKLKKEISKINKECQPKDNKFKRKDRIKLLKGGREIHFDAYGLEEKIVVETLEKIENLLNAKWNY